MTAQDEIAIVLDRLLPTSPMADGFSKPEDIADAVDLSVAYKPLLMPNGIYPKKSVTRLQNGKYAIYDVGWCGFEQSKHRWNVDEKAIRIHRARFLIQRDLIYQDLVIGVGERDDAPHFFRHWTGGQLIGIMPWEFRRQIAPLYFPGDVFLPSKENPLGESVFQNYVFADGSINVDCRSMEK